MSVTVFVAGIHGAGKSTICREFARLLGAFHATAGDLIRANAKATTEVTVGVKAVPNVDANQLLLLRGLAVYQARNSGPLLLDGHFVLLTPDGAIAEIPVTVYEAIAPVAVLLVEADAVISIPGCWNVIRLRRPSRPLPTSRYKSVLTQSGSVAN